MARRTEPCSSSRIAGVAERAGLELFGRGEKRRLRCPFHPDRTPSAFVSLERDLFYCSVCSPRDGRGLSAKRFAEALGLESAMASPSRVSTRQPFDLAPAFTMAMAEKVWREALERARCDDGQVLEEDAPVYQYLTRRGLEEAWDLGLVGTLGQSAQLPSPMARWPGGSYRLVCPLYDAKGELVSIQGRAIDPAQEPRVLTPRGAVLKGGVFSTAEGLLLLRSLWHGNSVILAEGLTDFLALAITAAVPVLSVPGSSFAAAAVSRWAHGRSVYLALDQDQAGEAGARSAAQEVYRLGGTPVRVRWPAGAKDACDVLEKLGPEGLSGFLSGGLADV